MINDKEKKELEQLNRDVDLAINKRKEWLDKKTIEKARYQIGEEIYNFSDGLLLGKVTKVYRHNPSGDLYDNGLSTHYVFTLDDQFFDNTSRYSFLCYGNKKELLEYKEKELLRLKGE
jgi:hypothetical protein